MVFIKTILQQKHFILSWDPIKIDFSPIIGGLTGVSVFAMSENMGVNHAFCLEPQFLPDSANRPEFPSTLLKSGEHFHKYAEYRFF